MMKILALGYEPLPFEEGKKHFAPGIRTWQLIQPLIKDSHDVCLICARMPEGEVDRSEEERKENIKGMTYYSLRRDAIHQQKRIEEICDDFKPDCIVGITHYPAYLASRLPPEIPFWADLFGHAIGEAQVKASSYNNNFHLQYSWNQELPTIRRADKFSVLSDNQKFATIGELGAVGRLNKKTVDYEFCYKISCGYFEKGKKDEDKILRGKLVNEDDFIVLWSGGYNTWTDIDTLFRGLEHAMEKNRRVKFVSLGGSIKGHDDKTYPRFLEMVEGSTHKDRYIFKGFIPADEVPAYLNSADVAISIDKFSYECLMGSRNRLIEWLFEGVLILTTRLCELSMIIESEKLGYTIQPGDPRGFGEMILKISDSKEEANERRSRGQDYGKKNFNFEITTLPLREWCRNPSKAPDYIDKFDISWGKIPRSIIYRNFLREHGIRGALAALTKKIH